MHHDLTNAVLPLNVYIIQKEKIFKAKSRLCSHFGGIELLRIMVTMTTDFRTTHTERRQSTMPHSDVRNLNSATVSADI